MARILVQTTMPHSEPVSSTFVRENGRLQLCMLANPKVGLPYGRYPRLLVAWIVTEAVRTKDPKIWLGKNLSRFMADLGLSVTGGSSGTVGRFRDQMKRLFSTTISVTEDLPARGQWHDAGFRISSQTHLWWNPDDSSESGSWGSHVLLGADFFQAITSRPVPIDLRVLRVLKSSLALDIYTWLTYRSSYLKKPCRVSWQSLAHQFGSDYREIGDFRRRFLQAARQVLDVYPTARLEKVRGGIKLRPSRPHIAKLFGSAPERMSARRDSA